MRQAIFLAMLFLSSGCTFNGTANLYPANKIAEEIGFFTIEYKDVGLQGPVAFATPDGESFRGNYTTIDNSLIGQQWGTVYAALPQTSAFATSVQTASIKPGSALGRLDAYGSRGTSIECEYAVNRATRGGLGVCKTSAGALYKMHFSISR